MRKPGRFLQIFLVVLTLTGLAACSRPAENRSPGAFDSLKDMTFKALKSNVDSALLISSELIRIADERNEDSLLYEAFLLKERAFHLERMNDSALEYAERMRQTAYRMNDTLRMLETCHTLGTLFVGMGSNDSVKYWYQEGLRLSWKTGNLGYFAAFSANMGLYFEQNGQPDSAMICYLEAVNHYEKSADSGNLATLYRNLGNLFLNQDRYLKANQYYRDAITIHQAQDNLIETGTDYTNLAVSHMMMGSDSALYFYHRASEILLEHGTIGNLLPVMFNLANYLKGQGKYDEADKMYQEVYRISKANKILQGEIYSLNQLGRIAAIRQDAVSADRFFQEAIRLAEENKLITDLIQFYHEAFEGNMELKRVEPAMRYFQRWEHLNDSLQTHRHQEAIQKYQTLYETRVLQSKVEKLNHEIELRKSHQIITFLISLSLILIVVTISVILIFRNKQAKQKQLLAEQRELQSEKERQLQRIELEKMTLEQQMREEQMNQLQLDMKLKEQDLVYQTMLRTDLHNLNKSFQEKLRPFCLQFIRKSDQEAFLKTLQEIARDTDQDPLKDFEWMFTQLHGQFFGKILTRCPDLSKSELLVAAMIRLNMSSKEIARLLNLSLTTVDKTRHHIRQKLGLGSGDSLTAFLISL